MTQPPGWTQPGGTAEQAGALPPPRLLYKPGIVALRPLTLADILDGAVAVVRRNPRSTIGFALLVLLAFALVPMAATVVAGLSGVLPTVDVSSPSTGSADLSRFNLVNSLVSLVTGLLTAMATVLITGVVVPTVARAVSGQKLTPAQAWAQARGRLLALVGLSVLQGLVGVVFVLVALGIPVGAGLAVGRASGTAAGLGVGAILLLLLGTTGLALLLWVHVRFFQLAPACLVMERRGVFDAMRRASELVRGQFWRVLGIWLLVALVTSLVSYVIAVPFSLVQLGALLGLRDSGVGAMLAILSANLGSVVSQGIVVPFAGAVAVLQYVDQRFRKEGFDLQLMSYADSHAPGGR